MATLLMIESWLQSTGVKLPPLLRGSGHRYVLLARDPAIYRLPGGGTHPVLEQADEVVVVETNDDDATVEAARAVASRRRICGVLTTCDYYLPVVALVSAALSLPGAPPDVLRAATRKDLARRAFARGGVPDAAHAVAGTWREARKAASDLGYPLVAKPVDLNSGTAVRRVVDETSLADAFAVITGPERNSRDQPLERLVLLEAVLDGPEVSVEAVTQDGRTRVLGITAKTVTEVAAPRGATGYIETGHLFPAPLDDVTRTAVESHTVAALAALGYRHGLSHTELRLTAAGPRVVELNPRQGGGFVFDLVRLVTGVSPLALLVDLSLGRDLDATLDGSRGGAAASAAVSFLISQADGVLRGVRGAEHLAHDPRVVAWEMPQPGRVVLPSDNNDRLGHVLVADRTGRQAKAWADEIVAGLVLDVDPIGSDAVTA
ncbi:ATP-grasp domain-containing protein [Antribacter sp. KLBMP9083]|uniref:ATP-grasp domain-containing protein n=1 Tax=Antribacter soli TaxID=2910976 RepID=A0AA41UBY9_9MICO|nr:ATP-grasp domain-containing protein [Antribacter soli]MCF4121574.1 ATP-grasp domain-containing protein [Antribacter soli]